MQACHTCIQSKFEAHVPFWQWEKVKLGMTEGEQIKPYHSSLFIYNYMHLLLQNLNRHFVSDQKCDIHYKPLTTLQCFTARSLCFKHWVII